MPYRAEIFQKSISKISQKIKFWEIFCSILIRFLAKQSLNNIDNTIDNSWISILQQIEIQFFIFLSLHKMIDKPSKGLDKTFFRLRNVILLQCKPKRYV